MPFVDSNDDEFLGEKSFAICMRLSIVMSPFPCTRILPRTWRAWHRELFVQLRKYLTAAKKEYQAEDTAEGLVQPMPASTEMFSFLARSASWSGSCRTSDRNQPLPKDQGGIDESIDLSRDR